VLFLSLVARIKKNNTEKILSRCVVTEQEKKKKSGKENAFHIEELPNANGIYDRESW
jgi:hypothetical protein